MTETTQVWLNPENGHEYAEGPHGNTLNGFPSNGRPEWAVRPADHVYGSMKPWAGGECPLPHDTLVRCLFRGRRPYRGEAIWPHMPERGKAGIWAHAPAPGRPDPAYDIVAYQVRIA